MTDQNEDDIVRVARKLSKLRRKPALFFRDYFDKLAYPDGPPPPPPPPEPEPEPGDPDAPMRWPAGHYYSPIPKLSALEARKREIWPSPAPQALHGIDLALERQLGWIETCRELRDELPDYPEAKPEAETELRYYSKNSMFGIGDALALYTIMRTKRPKRIVEVGSGFSSAVMLDVNERFLDRSVSLTFIDPYPERLHSLLRDADREQARVIDEPLQDVVLPLAKELEPNDILFIDSSHVSKTGSDVNYLLFEVLPELAPGVMIHVHDIAYPFEYPRTWVEQGRAWNEAYILRAFLMYNRAFRVEWFISSLKALRREEVADVPGGSYLWLQRVDN